MFGLGIGSGKLGKGFDDFLFGKDYSGKDKKLLNRVFGPLEQQTAGLYSGSQAALMKSLAAINKGYGGARDALASQGALGTKAILDREKQALAGNRQSLINQGLFGSTALQAADRGTGYATNDALAQLNAQLAQLGSNISIQQGQDQANVYGNLSGLNSNYASLLAQIGLGKAGLYSGIQYGKQGGALNDILKIGASIAGGGV